MEFWCPAVETVDLEGDGIGSIRTVHLAGIISKEKLLEVDARCYKIVYTILEPSPIALRNIISTLQLIRLNAETTDIIWSSVADEAPDTARDEAGQMVKFFYKNSVENLQKIPETWSAALGRLTANMVSIVESVAPPATPMGGARYSAPLVNNASHSVSFPTRRGARLGTCRTA